MTFPTVEILSHASKARKGAQENLDGYGQRLHTLEKLSSKATDDEHIFKQVTYGKRSLQFLTVTLQQVEVQTQSQTAPDSEQPREIDQTN